MEKRLGGCQTPNLTIATVHCCETVQNGSFLREPFFALGYPNAALKADCGTAAGAKALQPEKHQEYTRLSCQISSIRKGPKRSALEDLRAKFIENANHEIRQQLNGALASTFNYPKAEFGCPLRSQLPDAFYSVKDSATIWDSLLSPWLLHS